MQGFQIAYTLEAQFMQKNDNSENSNIYAPSGSTSIKWSIISSNWLFDS